MADDDNSVDRSEGTTPRASSRMTLKDATSKVKQEALRSLQLGDRTETETPSENPEEPMKEKESNDEEPPKAQPTATLAPASHEVDNEESVAPESSSEGERPTSGESRGVAGKRGVVEDKEEETDDGRSSEATDLADNGGRASEASSHVPTVAVPVGVGDDDDGSYGGDYSDSSLDVQPTGRKKPKRRPAVRRVFDSMDESDTGREGGRRKRDGDKSVSLVREEGDERVESRKKPRGKTRGGKRDVDVEEDEEESQEGDDEDGEGSTEKITESSPPVVTDTVEEVDTGKREESVSKDEEGDEEEEEDEDEDKGEELKEETVVEVGEIKAEEVEFDEEKTYDYEELKSKPLTSSLQADLVQLHYSFGYECQRRYNLHLMNDNTLIFIAGNMVQILNIETHEQTYMRSTTGGGIGAIAVHPSYQFFAVAEKGDSPPINIYHYPSLKLFRVLESGTQLAYSHLSFSHHGDKLASVGSYPDYMLTVWDWKNEQIILRTKAFSQEIYKVSFSTENEGQLTTSGTGHIRFWKMATTFTGLKLQGDIGKFGRTELTDISGYVELPDGKVLSGTEWGNMLLWDGGLIKVEISKKKKTCHNGMIEDIFLDEGELITVGADGYIKVWDFHAIDNADITEENSIFEIEPMTEIKIGSDVSLKSLVRSRDSDTIWFGQDANGGIWKIDVSVSHTRKTPTRLFSYHAGKVLQVSMCPVAHLAASIGEDASVRLFDYVSKRSLASEKFTSPGSCLIWAPKELDKNGSTLLAGFQDGVVRILSVVSQTLSAHSMAKSSPNNIAYSFELLQAFKPHSDAVTSLAINKTADILASGSEDSTVFFMGIGDPYEPIGFVKTPSPVISLQWIDRDGPKTVAFCRDGSVLEIESPYKNKYDTSKTFYLDPLNYKSFKFTSIKKRLLAEEEEAELKAEEAKKRLAEEVRRRTLGSDAEDEEEGKEEKKEKPVEEEEANEGDEEDEEDEEGTQEEGKLLCGIYNEKDNSFLLSMNGADAGYLYVCDFADNGSGEPKSAVKLPEINGTYETCLTSTHFTSNGRFVFFGTSDGYLRCHELASPHKLSFENFWTVSMHDNHHGNITTISTSHDDKFLLTAGADGNVFAYSFHGSQEAKPGRELKVAHVTGSVKDEKVEDIDDPTHYSIEEAKQKAEHDRMMRLAEEKKMAVRREVGLLRRQFKELMRKNQMLPGPLQMGKDEFVLDPHLRVEMEAQTRQKIELVYKEMAWEAEKYSIALQKMKKRFKSVIEWDRIVVRAFEGPYEVSTFRSAVPSSDYESILRAFRERQASHEEQDGASAQDDTSQSLTTGTDPDDAKSDARRTSKAGAGTSVETHATSKTKKSITKAEARKQKRLQRQKEWDALWKSKPDEHYEDSADVVAIQEAKRTMGDFKLKTASDYVVADDQRIDVDKKRTQIVLLREQIFEKKRYFNKKLLTLRDKKVNLVAKVQSDLKRLEDLQNELGPSLSLPLPAAPTLFPEEVPERKFEATVDKLKAFKRKYDSQKAEREKRGGQDDGGGFGGFGGFGGGGGGQEESKVEEKEEEEVAIVMVDEKRNETKEEKIEDGKEKEMSDLERQVEKARKMRMKYERDCLLEKVKKTIRNFDLELRALRHEKQYLEVALKQSDLRHVTQYEELLLLKEFEKRETVFAGKVTSKQTEKSDMLTKVSACDAKLASKQKDIATLHDREKDVHQQFTNSLGENNKFAEFLTKVFRKKIKRIKKKESAERESDSESEEESSDEELSSSDEESGSEAGGGVDDTVCPVGCTDELFEGTLKLREERLDVEELLVEEKKTAEMLRRESEGLKKKLKIIESGLRSAEADLQAFQLEKQAKLNELDIVVTLYLHQVQYVVGGTLPADLSATLVFGNSVIEKLQKRITELEQEKMQQKRLYKDNRLTYKQLVKEKKSLVAKVADLTEKADEMMMLKFGRVVNLEKLEGITVNRAVEELREKLRQSERKHAKEQANWQAELDALQEQMTTVLRENTARLEAYNELLLKQKDLEVDLNTRQKGVGNEYEGQRRTELKERRRLIELLQLQSQEIEGLKDEITVLSSKRGHVIPPPQQPMLPPIKPM